MKILVINCGSSTIKFQLYDMEENKVLAKGRCDQVGLKESYLIYKNIDKSIEFEKVIPIPDHKEGMKIILNTLIDSEDGVIKTFEEISAVGHRIVHGGEQFSRSVNITDEMLSEIEELSYLAPLHNPACTTGVRAIKQVMPNVINVGVFDTAFHQTIPEENYRYAIKQEYYEKYGMRKYGFHGSSYMYIISRLAEKLNKSEEDINAIVCHLGGGASVCAIKNGKSFDTSMGFTPLQGLIMETRCGDIDPSVAITLMEKENLNYSQITKVLNKESGRLGFCGIGDHRQVCAAADKGEKDAELILKMQNSRTKQYIGAYMAHLNRVDAIVFTGGIGENDASQRMDVLKNMEYLGIKMDKERNFEGSRKESIITAEDSIIKAFVIPTDEEFEIAKQTKEVYYDTISKE